MWFWVWSLLVVGTVVGAFFLGRSLWRSAKGVLREVGRASQMTRVAADLVAERTAERAASAAGTGHTLFDDPVELRARVLELRAERAGRREARRERHRVTWERWARFNA